MTSNWSPLHETAWKGQSWSTILLLNKYRPESKGQSPLYLALTRWGTSARHQKMIQALWGADLAPQLARWGDTAWGGGLSLLELVVQEGLVWHIPRCKACGLKPHERTWSMALLHESDDPMIALGLAFDPPDYLPQDNVRVSKMLTARETQKLDEDTGPAGGESGRRRL